MSDDSTVPQPIQYLQDLFNELQYSTAIIPDEEGFDPSLGVMVELPYEEIEDTLMIRIQYCDTGEEIYDELIFADSEDENDDDEADSSDEGEFDDEDDVDDDDFEDDDFEDDDFEDDDFEDEDFEDEDTSLEPQSHTIDFQLVFPFQFPDAMKLEAFELCSELNKTTFLTPWRFDSKSNRLFLQYQLLLATEIDENDLSIDIVEQFQTIALEIYPLLIDVLSGKYSLNEVISILEASEFDDLDGDFEDDESDNNK